MVPIFLFTLFAFSVVMSLAAFFWMLPRRAATHATDTAGLAFGEHQLGGVRGPMTLAAVGLCFMAMAVLWVRFI